MSGRDPEILPYSEGEGDSVGEGDGEASSFAFFAGDSLGEASAFVLFFVEDELEVLPSPAFFVVDVEVFLVAAVDECVVEVVAAVSSLCAHDTMKAVAAMTVVNPKTSFFIVRQTLNWV